MKSKLTIQQLSQRMAERCGLPAEVCEAFVRVLFKNIEQAVLSGEFAKTSVGGLGNFEVVLDASGAKTLMFEPDASLAAAVNGPFAMFVPEMLNNDVTDQMLEDVSAGQSQEESSETVSGTLTVTAEAETAAGADASETLGTPAESEVMIENVPTAIGQEPQCTPAPVVTSGDTIENYGSAELTSNAGTSVTDTLTEDQASPTVDEAPEAEVDTPRTDVLAISTPLDDSNVSSGIANIETRQPQRLNDASDDDSSPTGFSMLSFIVGLVAGLALGAVAAFFYMSVCGQPQNADDLETEIVEE